MIKKLLVLLLILMSGISFSKTEEKTTIFIRRSIRRYLPQKVEKEKIDKILRAAMQGPAAGGQKSWEFLVIDNPETLKSLAGLGPYSDPVGKAPLAILVVGTPEGTSYPELVDYDLSVATQNILLQSVEEGLGAVWLSVAPYPERMEYVKKQLNIPENKFPFALVPIGYSKEKNRFIDRYENERVYYNKY